MNKRLEYILFQAFVLFSFGQGLFAITFNINNTTLYQRRVPEHLRGRVFSVRILLAQAGIPFGAALGGLFAEAFSIPLLFAVLGILIVLTNLICWMHPIFEKLNDHEIKVDVDNRDFLA